MKKIITKIICDVCGNETENDDDVRIQVIFTTEQNEGRGCKPYLCDKKLNLCDNCVDKLLQGNYIFASGAMGVNKYNFKS